MQHNSLKVHLHLNYDQELIIYKWILYQLDTFFSFYKLYERLIATTLLYLGFWVN